MKGKPLLLSQMSGSLGGLTASRNRGGSYLRQRSIPVNPGTPDQEFIRATMADLVVRWKTNLTAEQRDLWETYAANTPITDRIGEKINLTGQTMYIRSNISRLQAALARVDNAPNVFDLGSFTPPSLVPDASADTLAVTFANTDAWAAETGSAMLVYASRPQDPTINFYKGPYRFAGRINGAPSPPTSPATLPSPFQIGAAGQKVFLFVRVSRADGRLSDSFRDFGVVVA